MRPLSRRQAELIEMLIRGTSQKRAAEILRISTSSAGVHVARARVKLGAKTRDQAIAIYTRERVKDEI